MLTAIVIIILLIVTTLIIFWLVNNQINKPNQTTISMVDWLTGKQNWFASNSQIPEIFQSRSGKIRHIYHTNDGHLGGFIWTDYDFKTPDNSNLILNNPNIVRNDLFESTPLKTSMTIKKINSNTVQIIQNSKTRTLYN